MCGKNSGFARSPARHASLTVVKKSSASGWSAAQQCAEERVRITPAKAVAQSRKGLSLRSFPVIRILAVVKFWRW